MKVEQLAWSGIGLAVQTGGFRHGAAHEQQSLHVFQAHHLLQSFFDRHRAGTQYEFLALLRRNGAPIRAGNACVQGSVDAIRTALDAGGRWILLALNPNGGLTFGRSGCFRRTKSLLRLLEQAICDGRQP